MSQNNQKPPQGGNARKPGTRKGNLIFRRFRTVKGVTYDAHDYGYRAWPIRAKG